MVTKSSDPFNKIIVNLFASSVDKSEWRVWCDQVAYGNQQLSPLYSMNQNQNQNQKCFI